ncbi:MAG: energy-coupling factor transporter ATPase [Clostridiales bacterium]|jgi:energy-coupling factor transport system ATP-binding protein|nr:energy-coupling factor transporter ATPase [Clostridiales bacterium]HQD41110.1 energy-coupling factor transporter ATPase [Bacillota bacterium]
MEYQVIMEGLCFRYSDQEEMVLRDINLKVKKGEFVVIIGHNGSGKSTLAKHINALLVPSLGKVEVMGMDTRDPAKAWEIRQRVGMVFQNPDNQLVAAIVEEDVAFGPENQGVPTAEIRKRVDEALREVGLYEYRTHGPHLLSGGQKQRVAIAGVLAMRPDCIVLDEATAMLDPRGRQEFMEVVRRLNKQEGKTIIHITHYMEEAVQADRVLVMDQGRIVLEGTPGEVFSKAGRLKELGLDVPALTELALKLRKKGVQLPEILTEDEMVVELCRLKSQT